MLTIMSAPGGYFCRRKDIFEILQTWNSLMDKDYQER
jgi:hypothetical protein